MHVPTAVRRVARPLAIAWALAVPAVAAHAECPPATPDDVLACLALAHAEEDLDLYASLLAPDYVLRVGDEVASRELDLAAMEKLFASAVELRVSFDDGYRVLDGERAGTWRVVDLTMRAKLTTAAGDAYDVSTPIELVIGDTPGVGLQLLEFVSLDEPSR